MLGVENCAENTDASHIISLLQMAVLDAVAQYCKALRYFLLALVEDVSFWC